MTSLACSESTCKRIFHQLSLLHLVNRMRPRSGAGARRAACVTQGLIGSEYAQQARLYETPAAIIPWLFLHPHHVGRVGEAVQLVNQLLLREWVELIDAHKGRVLIVAPRARVSKSRTLP